MKKKVQRRSLAFILGALRRREKKPLRSIFIVIRFVGLWRPVKARARVELISRANTVSSPAGSVSLWLCPLCVRVFYFFAHTFIRNPRTLCTPSKYRVTENFNNKYSINSLLSLPRRVFFPVFIKISDTVSPLSVSIFRHSKFYFQIFTFKWNFEITLFQMIRPGTFGFSQPILSKYSMRKH